MKKLYKIFSFLAFSLAFSLSGLAQNAWINEIHYDNVSTDVNEFIEVVIENPGSYNLADFSVVLYNGNGGASYDTKTLDVFTAGTVYGNFTFYYYIYPANGIQNGAPDGMALVYQTSVISGQWLSYEGTMTATNGPATGLLSVDIGVLEAGTEPAGLSLQLTGTGTQYSAFSWVAPAAETHGLLNNGQSLGGAPLPEPSNYPTGFAASPDNITIALEWTDATGTQLPSKYLIKVSDTDNITAPVDGTPVDDDLDLGDGTGAINVPYNQEAYTFFHLDGATAYFFKIYPYTNAGATIDYKTDGTPPATSATTEPVILQEDFESTTFGAWTAYSVASDKDWTVVNFPGALSTAYFAQINGYQENEPSNDWLISPSMNLDIFGNEKMIFYSQWRFGDVDTELTLKYSTNYNGGDPTLATWTDLTFTKSTVQDIWTYSGHVMLDGIVGTNVRVAFQYLSSGNPRRWGVDEIVICGGAAGPYIGVSSPVQGDIWEQGTTHDITWSASNTQDNVKIELTTDASSGTPTWTVLAASVPASQGSWTWNISPTQTTSDDCKIRISDFAADVAGYSGTFSIIEPIYIPQLVITEIMYNPPESGNDSLEFIEIYNNDVISVDLEGYYLANAVDFTFPALTMDPGDFMVVAIDSVAFLEFFGVTAYQFDGALGNSGEEILLYNNYGMLVDSVMYDDAEPWPTEPDGFGPSLRFCDPGLDNSIPDYWTVSEEYAGANGDGDSLFCSPGTGCANWPVADFNGDPTVVIAGGSVQFTDASTGEPDTWIWTFPGGTPGSYVGQNPPAIVYNTPGTYDVVLYVENMAGSSTKEKTEYIQVGLPPAADFSGSPLTLFAGETVDFTDLSTNSPDTWEWVFEGGTPGTSDEQNPANILYASAGVYTVTLTVTNMFGTSTLEKEDYIDVQPVGLEENAVNAFTIWPNPTPGVVMLDNRSGGELTLTVTSLTGQVILESMALPGKNSIDLSGTEKGVYFVRMTGQNGESMGMQKVIRY